MKRRSIVVELIGSAIFGALGVAVCMATGLYDAADSSLLRMALAGTAAYWFVTAFRLAIHGR